MADKRASSTKLPKWLKAVADKIGAYGIFLSTATSVGSLLISTFTLYWTTLRPAHIVVMHGPLIQFSHWQNDGIGINLPIVLQNTGGRAATVKIIALRVFSANLSPKIVLGRVDKAIDARIAN
jgi:hypothetical protein